jgi:hypothetical protein
MLCLETSQCKPSSKPAKKLFEEIGQRRESKRGANTKVKVKECNIGI